MASVHDRARPTAALAVLLFLAALAPAVPAAAQAPGDSWVVISQVYGGGGNSGAVYTNDFVELFNRGTEPIDLSGWSLQYASAAGTTWFNRTNLPDGAVLEPGQYYLVAQTAGAGAGDPLPDPDARGSINMAATNGKIALVATTDELAGSCPERTDIVDLVGYGTANCFEGDGAAPQLSNATAALRTGDGCDDTDDNAADFVRDTPDPRTTASPLNACDAEPPPVSIDCESAIRTVEGAPATTTVTATATEARVVDISITAVEPATDAITVTDLAEAPDPGAAATAEITVGGDTPGGDYAVEVTATDDSFAGETATCTVSVTVVPILPIGEVQGAVSDDDDGHTHRSPFAPPSGNSAGQEEVAVRGVVHQRTLQRTGAGNDQHGFFLQNAGDTADGDPDSSDGLFVFMGQFDDLRVDGGGFYTPEIGDEVVLRGRVNEFFFLTQLSNPFVVDVVRTGVDIDEELVTTGADPPDDVDEAGRYWERLEGMRVRVPADSQVIGGRDVFTSSMDGEVWLIRGDHPVAQRDDPYAQRVFRDAHPLDNNPGENFDDGNGYRIMVGSLGVKAAAGDNTELIAPARTFDTVTNAPAGGLYYSFGKYGIQVAEQLELDTGVDPSENATPEAFDRTREYSTAIYNVENLYDFRDDPNDGCDFPGNEGCRDFFGRLSVTPPFDYVPASEEAYEARLGRLAAQILVDLHAPDVVLIQETEDQDICEADYDALELVCHFDGRDDVSGHPDSLTELALTIERRGGPRYHAVLDRDGADTRGITSGYLYRTDRVELPEPEVDDPVLGGEPTVDYRGEPAPDNKEVANPKALNAVRPDDVSCDTGCLTDTPYVFPRAPQVALFRVWRDGIGESTFTDFYATSNHFSAGPDGRVGQRTEQAAYNAAIADAIREADEDARVVVGGDLNVFPRPDDPFPPGDALFPSDQLAPLYDDARLENLYDTLVVEEPSTAYSFVFQGQAQTLDHFFVSAPFLAEFNQIRGAKINSDWPADHDGYGRFGASDHDPEVARFDALPTIDRLEALVRYHADAGRISGNRTEQILHDRLERAARLFQRGQDGAARSQLQAFADQVRDFTPRFIDRKASDALVTDTLLLLDP